MERINFFETSLMATAGTFGVDQYIKVISVCIIDQFNCESTQFLLKSVIHRKYGAQVLKCGQMHFSIAFNSPLRRPSAGSKELEVVGGGDSGGNDSYAQNGRAGCQGGT